MGRIGGSIDYFQVRGRVCAGAVLHIKRGQGMGHRLSLSTPSHVLVVVENLARAADRIIVEGGAFDSGEVSDLSPLAQFGRKRAVRRQVVQLQELVDHMDALWQELIHRRFQDVPLPPMVITEEMQRAAAGAAPGSPAYMEVAARTTGGFWSVLFSLQTAFCNLVDAVSREESRAKLLHRTQHLYAFALCAYHFYELQPKEA